MEIHPTPFPVKSKYLQPKLRKNVSETEANSKGGPLIKQKRVFGTSRNPNIPLKSAPQKPKPKSSSVTIEKSAIKSQTKQSSDEIKAKAKKKSVFFQENYCVISEDGNLIEPKTPMKPVLDSPKGRISSTPYRSAERCSKCRFDRLETSAYWLGQINLAESVGKHFVSASFFQLALECKAEPFSSIKVELKKYLTRHEYLNGEDEWKNLSISYGLLKHESCARQKMDKVEVAIQESSAREETGKTDTVEEDIAVFKSQCEEKDQLKEK